MPIYAYRCAACGHARDVLRKLSDPLLTDCPACGAAQFSKQVTAAGFQLKGSGWYATDFKGGGAAAEKKPADKADSNNGAAAADGKPAAAPNADNKAAAPAAAAPPAAPATGKDAGSKAGSPG